MTCKLEKKSHGPLIIAAILCILSVSVWAQTDYASLILGPADPLAVDQPRVSVQVINPDTGSNMGPSLANQFLLDTGAQGMMVVGYAVTELEDSGLVYDGVFRELGIGGFNSYDLTAPYRLDFSGTDYRRITIGNDVRMIASGSTYFGSFGGIIGTPAMVGRVTELDMANMLEDPYGFGFDYLGVFFSDDDPPAVSAGRYSVNVTLFDFPPPAQADPTAPLPTYGPLPFIVAGAMSGEHETYGDFVLDTGAQASMISSSVAFALGLDANGDGSLLDDAVGVTEFQGVGGTIEVPLLEIDRIVLPTIGGVDLVWTDLAIPVYDIDESIAGIFGCDLLTTGWFRAVFDTGDTGAIESVWLDFRDYPLGNGVMHIDVAMDYDFISLVQHPQGDADRDGDVDIYDFLLLRANYGIDDACWSQGDFDRDGDVDIYDFLLLRSNYGSTSQ